MAIIHGTIAQGITLAHAGAYESPLTITNKGAVETAAASTDAILGPASGAPWTVVNDGTVAATGAFTLGSAEAEGILLYGGIVSNTGLIEGSSSGIYITGAAGTVTNSGTIHGLGDGFPGMELNDGGRVSNSGVVIGGIYVRHTPGTIINSGTVEIPTTATGVYLGDGGRFSNSGTIDSTGRGVDIDGGGTVVNATGGLIEAANNSAGVEFFAGTAGAVLVENHGTISASGNGVALHDGGKVVNSGQIYSQGNAYAAVFIEDASGSVVNSGRLQGAGAGVSLATTGSVVNEQGGFIDGVGANGHGIDLAEGGTVVNYGGVYGHEDGLSVSNAPGTLINSNDVSTGLAGSTGVYLQQGGLVVNEQGKYITGAKYGIVVHSGDATIVNAGKILGGSGVSVQFSYGGAGLVVVDPGAIFSGLVEGPGTAGILELAQGSGIGTLGGFGTSFVSFGTLAVDAKAVWALSGYADGYGIVNDGRIIVEKGQSLTLGPVGEDASDHGTIDLVKTGAVEMAGSVAAGQSLLFTETGGFLKLDDPAGFAALISGFKAGDTIDLVLTAADGKSFANHQLTITDGGNVVATLDFQGKFTTNDFTLSTDHNGGTDITIGPPKGTARVFARAGPHAFGDDPRGGAFEPFGRAAAGIAAATGPPDGQSPLPWAADPFHFWTIQD